MEPQATFKSRDAASYDSLADSFDRHTEKYSGYAVDHLLSAIDLEGRGQIIDIGCGTGVVSLALARRATNARIVGIDLSDGMLAFARAKAERLGLADRLTFRKDDAEALSLDDASVDSAVSLYAWRHLPDPGQAAAEVFRVLRPGGRFALAVGSSPTLLSLAGARAAFDTVRRRGAKAIGRELDACEHIDGLVERLLPPGNDDEAAAWTGAHHEFSGSLASLLEGAGFRIVGSDWQGRQYQVPTAEDFWDLQTTFSSIARKRMAEATDAQRQRVRAAFDDDCSRVRSRGGRFIYRVGAAIVCAEKP